MTRQHNAMLSTRLSRDQRLALDFCVMDTCLNAAHEASGLTGQEIHQHSSPSPPPSRPLATATGTARGREGQLAHSARLPAQETAPLSAGRQPALAYRRDPSVGAAELRAADTNLHGVVTQDEYVAARTGETQAQAARRRQRELGEELDAGAAFRGLDADGDGGVSEREFVRAAMRRGAQQPRGQQQDLRRVEQEAKRTFAGLDADGDGRVSRDEFVRAGLGETEAQAGARRQAERRQEQGARAEFAQLSRQQGEGRAAQQTALALRTASQAQDARIRKLEWEQQQTREEGQEREREKAAEQELVDKLALRTVSRAQEVRIRDLEQQLVGRERELAAQQRADSLLQDIMGSEDATLQPLSKSAARGVPPVLLPASSHAGAVTSCVFRPKPYWALLPFIV